MGTFIMCVISLLIASFVYFWLVFELREKKEMREKSKLKSKIEDCIMKSASWFFLGFTVFYFVVWLLISPIHLTKEVRNIEYIIESTKSKIHLVNSSIKNENENDEKIAQLILLTKDLDTYEEDLRSAKENDLLNELSFFINLVTLLGLYVVLEERRIKYLK